MAKVTRDIEGNIPCCTHVKFVVLFTLQQGAKRVQSSFGVIQCELCFHPVPLMRSGVNLLTALTIIPFVNLHVAEFGPRR